MFPRSAVDAAPRDYFHGSKLSIAVAFHPMAAGTPEPVAAVDFVGGPFALFTHLARTSLFLDALQEECLEPFGIGFGDFAALRLLQDAPDGRPMSPTRLAELVVLTTGGMTKVVDRLERLGHVRRMKDPNDGRGVLVALTPKGRRTCDAASAAYVAGRERVLARLDEGEIAAVESALSRLRMAFEMDRDAQRAGSGGTE
jgi:DNA-binding MarR family transcriptional regulator